MAQRREQTTAKCEFWEKCLAWCGKESKMEEEERERNDSRDGQCRMAQAESYRVVTGRRIEKISSHLELVVL